MIHVISSVSTTLYSRVFRPVLFTFSADSVHGFITNAGIVAQKIPFMMSVLRYLWRYDNPKLVQKVAGIEFGTPLGLSAGFDKEARLPQLMQAVGYGQEEVGSITAEPYAGNPKPWYTRLPHTKSVLVYSGLRSSGVEKIADRADTMSSKNYENFIINASVAKTNSPQCDTVEKGIADYCKSLKRLEKSPWPRLYTINISCPNTMGGEPFNQPKNLAKLLRAIDDLKLSRPVFLKLPIDLDWKEVKPLVDVAVKSSLTGLTVGNLAKDRSTVDPRDNLTDAQKGNLSGRPCWHDSNKLLAQLYASYGDRFIYSGVGGVFSAEDAYTKIKLGASLVEMITGMIYGGPAIVGQINKGLVDLLERDGYTHISEAVGVNAKQYIKEHV